ncbi:hypothetical protein AB0M20_39695 [Actinoplanes sp. NPDC051633]|uniref:hypothetical protein n=1 Tax=Actinoplanes sp. NPDC051633 TaxID=3155670 RepID=UPI003426B185
MRAAGLVNRWVRCYTRRLPEDVARGRVDEIEADLHDHVAYERGRGVGDRRIAISILSRMIRGLAADASWRGRIRPWSGDLMKSLAAIFAAAMAIAVVGVGAVVYGGEDDAPGLVLIGLLLIAGALAVGMRMAHRRGRAN